MTIEVHHQDGTGDVAITTRDRHTVSDTDMVVAWDYDGEEMRRVVKFPRENVVRVVVLDDDETAVSDA